MIRKMHDDLQDAAMRDNAHDAQTVLSGKADPNARRDMHNLTPLHYAAHPGNADQHRRDPYYQKGLRAQAIRNDSQNE